MSYVLGVLRLVCEDSSYLYHATLDHHVESIARTGLGAHSQANWDFKGNPKGAVYLSKTADNAMWYGNIAARNHMEEFDLRKRPGVALLRVKEEHMKPENKIGQSGHDSAWRQVIHPDHLEILHQGEWHPITHHREKI